MSWWGSWSSSPWQRGASSSSWWQNDWSNQVRPRQSQYGGQWGDWSEWETEWRWDWNPRQDQEGGTSRSSRSTGQAAHESPGGGTQDDEEGNQDPAGTRYLYGQIPFSIAADLPYGDHYRQIRQERSGCSLGKHSPGKTKIDFESNDYGPGCLGRKTERELPAKSSGCWCEPGIAWSFFGRRQNFLCGLRAAAAKSTVARCVTRWYPHQRHVFFKQTVFCCDLHVSVLEETGPSLFHRPLQRSKVKCLRLHSKPLPACLATVQVGHAAWCCWRSHCGSPSEREGQIQKKRTECPYRTRVASPTDLGEQRQCEQWTLS